MAKNNLFLTPKLTFWALSKGLRNPCTQAANRFSILKWKMKNKSRLLACFFLQRQKASRKTCFRLNKFYLKITISFQSLTLLRFIFRFSKWIWKTKIEIISFYGDLKSTDLFTILLMNMSSRLIIHQETPFLRWSINAEFSVFQPAVCEIRFQWHRISDWMEYCWMWADHRDTSRRYFTSSNQWDHISSCAEWILLQETTNTVSAVCWNEIF